MHNSQDMVEVDNIRGEYREIDHQTNLMKENELMTSNMYGTTGNATLNNGG
jgi:hypothetical protein